MALALEVKYLQVVPTIDTLLNEIKQQTCKGAFDSPKWDNM